MERIQTRFQGVVVLGLTDLFDYKSLPHGCLYICLVVDVFKGKIHSVSVQPKAFMENLRQTTRKSSLLGWKPGKFGKNHKKNLEKNPENFEIIQEARKNWG